MTDERTLKPVRGAVAPDTAPAPRVSAPGRSAGGVGAILSSAAHLHEEAGLLRGSKAILRMNQRDGFDCPGCAWPDPSHRSTFEFCENGAKALASAATQARADAAFFEAHEVAELQQWPDRALNDAGRLCAPMLRRAGSSRFEPLSWDEALDCVASELTGLNDPNEAVFYTSGRTSNEAAFLYQLFVRTLGTNNLPDCSNMCHESSGSGLSESIGIGKGTVTLEDFDEADLILVIGQNPGTNHPRMLSTLQRAARRGATIVSINPLAEAGTMGFRHPQEVRGVLGWTTPLASVHVPVRVNGDVALLNGVMKAMFEDDAASGGQRLDHAFLEERTSGVDALQALLARTAWSELVQASGVDEATMRDLARRCLRSRATIACWAMGLTQHENGVANVQTVTNLLLLGGHIGRPGAGVCPVRGHSNVQGDRTVGIWERAPVSFLRAMERHFETSLPREHGVDVVGAIERMEAGRVGVFMAMGGNFLSAAPDTHRTAAGLARCRLHVAVATKLNRSHLVDGVTTLLLPCLARTETDLQPGGAQFVTVENSMGYVHASRGTMAPASSELRSEVRIVAELAERVGRAPTVRWRELADDYGRIRDAIEACVEGFEGYDERVQDGGGFYLPNGPREGVFPTPDGRARIVAHAPPVHELAGDELLMMTIRSHDQYNTTVYGDDDRYRGVRGGRRVVFAHEADLAARGLSDGDQVDITASYGGVVRRVERFRARAYEIPRGCVATYFPECNPLVPLEQFAQGSRTPASKSVRVRLVASQR